MPRATIIIKRPASTPSPAPPPRLWIELLETPPPPQFQTPTPPTQQLLQPHYRTSPSSPSPSSSSLTAQTYQSSSFLSASPPPPPPPPPPLPQSSSSSSLSPAAAAAAEPAIMSMTTTTTTTSTSTTTAATATTSNGSSFPRRATFHKIIGSIILILILASMAIVAGKHCTEPAATEAEVQSMTAASGPSAEAPSAGAVRTFVARYYYKLHLLHLFSLGAAFLVVLFSALDLVPTRDDDIKYAFHFVSVFAIFCVSFATLYAAFLAFTRPCGGEKPCCAYRMTASLLATSSSSSGASSSDARRQALTAISAKDVSMSAILVLDTVAGLLQLLVAVVYFRDVRQEAAECGYLYRVHNEGYIIR